MNQMIDTIKSRRSVRSFKPEQVKNAELKAILEAGSFPPSAMNGQSRHFTAVQRKPLLENMNTHGISAYDQVKVDKLLKVDGDNELVIYLAPVGKM